MAQWNGPITEEYFKETVAALDRAHTTVEDIKKMLQELGENSQVPYDFSVSKAEEVLEKIKGRKDKLVKQYTCKHQRTTGLVNVGHDSHKDHYENKCLDCGYVLEWDVY